jgi:hypothetical protein
MLTSSAVYWEQTLDPESHRATRSSGDRVCALLQPALPCSPGWQQTVCWRLVFPFSGAGTIVRQKLIVGVEETGDIII